MWTEVWTNDMPKLCGPDLNSGKNIPTSPLSFPYSSLALSHPFSWRKGYARQQCVYEGRPIVKSLSSAGNLTLEPGLEFSRLESWSRDYVVAVK